MEDSVPHRIANAFLGEPKNLFMITLRHLTIAEAIASKKNRYGGENRDEKSATTLFKNFLSASATNIPSAFDMSTEGFLSFLSSTQANAQVYCAKIDLLLL
jgi:hypothetical protein